MAALAANSSYFKCTDTLSEEMARFFAIFGHSKTAVHCAEVAAKARELAVLFGSDPSKAEAAGLLHDISAVIPNDDRIVFAESEQIDVLAAERQCPMIIHQKLSAVVAEAFFDITDIEILSAISCHTTLKANATQLDKVVFLADKIAWDQDGQPPYIVEMLAALPQSLDAAVLVYLNHLWEQRAKLQVIHPWFVAARNDLIF